MGTYRHVAGVILHACMHPGGVRPLSINGVYEAGGVQFDVSEKCVECGEYHTQHWCAPASQYQVLPVVRQAPPPWFPLLNAVVRASCPTCGWAADLANTVANDPEATVREREAALGFRNGIVAVSSFLLALRALSWLSEEGA